MGIYGTSIKQTVCPDPVWKPVIKGYCLEYNVKGPQFEEPKNTQICSNHTFLE